MEQALTALFAAALGAVLSGVGTESYKRYRDRQGTASAIVGEIFALIDMSKKRNYIQSFTQIAEMLEAGKDVKIPNIISKRTNLDPVITTYMDRIGLLGGTLPERIATFYQYLNGIRTDLINLADGVHDNFSDSNSRKAKLIREDLALWDETEKLAAGLIDELRAVAKEQWWPASIWISVINRFRTR